MDKTPEKMNNSNLSNSSIRHSSGSFSKEGSQTQDTKNHSHKHDKTKCVICLAKTQKNVLKKKDSHHEESKKLTSVKSMSESTKLERIPEIKEFTAQVPEKPDLVMKTIRHPSLTLLFDPQRDEYPNKPYHLDGDPKMSSKNSIITLSKGIKFMILYQFDFNSQLSKKGYIDINYKIMGILRPDLKEKPEEMKFTLEQDWKHDSKGQEKMKKEDLFDSLFEMADIWTQGVDNFEYGSFFDMMKMKIILEEQKNPNEVPYDILY